MRTLYFQSESALNTFNEACLSLTPKIYSHGAHEVYLDIGITTNLFKGEENILRRFEDIRSLFNLKGGLILADRLEWAKPLAMDPPLLLPVGKSQERLFALPIDRILFCGDPVQVENEKKERESLIAFMKRVGLRFISDFANLNAMAIGRRFGKMGIILQQWVMGTREICLPTFSAEEPIREKVNTEDVFGLEPLLFLLQDPFARIENRLVGRNLLAKCLKLTFGLDSGHTHTKTLPLSEPMREAKPILKLLGEFLRNTQWDAPMLSLEILVSDSISFQGGQLSLFDKGQNQFASLANYVNRLRTRLGESQAGFADLQESYVPERSWKFIGDPKEVKTPPERPPLGLRPPLLYSPPRPFHPPRNAQLIPSENIATAWWESGVYRKYFVAHLPNGDRLWVYWDCQNHQWFLHGTFE